MIQVVHFSDWHLREVPAWRQLPSADLYVCTGDMLPDFPIPNTRKGIGKTLGRWIIERDSSKRSQEEWISKQPSLRSILMTPDAPVVVVRGNHDFTDLAPLFGGEVYEIGEDPTVVHEVLGLRVGGMRGIPFICGFWSDELYDPELDERVQQLPHDLDLLVTHSPPYGYLDQHPPGRNLGSRALARHLMQRNIIGRMPRAMTFGHIHESLGMRWLGNTVLSNAATTFNQFTIYRDEEEEREHVEEEAAGSQG